MSIDYKRAAALTRRHKSALTRARKAGPSAVVQAVNEFYADFDEAGLPLPDAWHTWESAKQSALHALAHGGGLR